MSSSLQFVMRRLIGSVSFLLAASLAAAQSRPPDQLCVLTGQVRDGNTSQPIRMAQVVLRPEAPSIRPLGATTDDSGNFKIENVDAGRYRLTATRTGYLRQEYGAKWPERAGTLLALRPGQHLADLVLRLTAQAVVTGGVTDDRGEPVTSANVQAMRVQFSNGRPQLALVRGSLTNDLGEYRIFGLPPGRYFVSAVAPEPAASADPGAADREKEGFAPLFYPAAAQPAGASPLEVSGGQNLQGIDFRLIRTPVARVKGVVVNMAGVRPGRTMIRLMPRDSGMFGIVAGKFTSRIGTRGEFELNQVPTGSYVLSAKSYEGSNRFNSRQLLEVGRSGVEGVKLMITAGLTIAGLVTVEGQKPSNLAGMRVRLLPQDNVMFEGQDVQISTDASFVLQHVAADSYAVDVRNVPEGFYVKSIRIGDQEVLGRGVTIPEGGLGARVEIILSDHGGTVAGSVAGPERQPAPGALVVLVPAAESPPRPDLLRQTTSNQGGAFSLKGIAPGKYRIFAFESLEDPGICMDPEFVKGIADKGQVLEIEENGSAAVQLLTISGTSPL